MGWSLVHVLGLSSCLWIGIFVSAQRARETFGSSGQVCEEGFRKCLRGPSTCVNGRCQCNAGESWRGSFACYPPNWYHAEVYNDPSLKTFARETTNFPINCRYLFSHFRSVYIGWGNGSCEVMVHAYNRKIRGKVVVYGFDLALKVLSPLFDPADGVVSFRHYGTAQNGSYLFQDSGAQTFSPNGPWDLSDPPATLYLQDAVVRTRFDPYNNFVFVQVDPCGFSVRFRPFDELYGRNQPQLPGLALTVSPDNEPEWLSLDKVVALVPEGEPNFESISTETGLDPEHAVLLRFAQSRVTQNQPIAAAAECRRLSDVVTSCGDETRRKAAFETCTFLLDTPKLKKCLDRSFDGNDILNVFNRCFQSVCLSDTTACAQVQDEVDACTNDAISEIPPVIAFLQPETCIF